MKVLNLENKNDVLNFLDKIDYGSTYFISKDIEVSDFVYDCVKIINKSTQSDSVRVELEKLVDILEQYNLPNEYRLYKVISSKFKKELPNLSNDSFYIERYMNEAFNNKILVRFDLDPSLYDYAKKIAKNKVLFQVDKEGSFFQGVEKQLSVYEQIVKSFYNGDSMIQFNSANVSIATVRCYTSTISKMSGKKLKCGIKEGVVTVYLKPISKKDDIKNKIQYLLNEFDSEKEGYALLSEMINDFSKDAVKSVIIQGSVPENRPVYIVDGAEVTAHEWAKQPIWIRQGYATEDDMNNDF